MYTTDEELKSLYRADRTMKNMIAEFRWPGEEKPFLAIYDNTKFHGMTMEESLSSDENLEFGSCEASEVKITISDISGIVKGSEMTLYQTLNGLFPEESMFPSEDMYPSGYVMPFGKYIVQSAEKQENSNFRDIKALDFMSLFDVNVIEWYNSLTFPMTLRSFRASLCQYIGVTESIPDYLPNDDMVVEKTIDTAELIGRDILIACEQANGVFGHFDRNGILQHVALQPNDRLVPALDLYPDEDLFPQAPGDMNTQTFDEQLDPYLLISCNFEEHTVKSIDKVQIRQEEGDIGAIYGSGTNAYTVEGNFLMFGKSADELAEIAQNIYGMVSGRMYIPFESESKGLPYLEVGDAARFEFGSDSIVSYIIKRTLKGIYALRDSYSATGEEIRSTESNINTDIIQTKGRVAILKKNVDEVSARVIDLGKNTEAQLKITAEKIESTVKRIGEAESQIKQTADSISLMVKKGDVSAQISIETGGVSIKGNRFSWESTNSSMTADGTLTCKNGIFNGQVTATSGKIGGFDISGNNLTASSDNTEIRFGDYYMNRSGCTFKNVEIDEDGIYIGSIGNRYTHRWESETGDLYANELYIDQNWWKGWSLTETVQDLWEYVHGGGWDPCGSDDDCDSCDSGCDGGDIPLEDDIGGC